MSSLLFFRCLSRSHRGTHLDRGRLTQLLVAQLGGRLLRLGGRLLGVEGLELVLLLRAVGGGGAGAEPVGGLGRGLGARSPDAARRGRERGEGRVRRVGDVVHAVAGETAGQGAESSGRRGEDGQGHLDAGPLEQLVVKPLRLVSAGSLELDEDDELGDGRGACAVGGNHLLAWFFYFAGADGGQGGGGAMAFFFSGERT